MVDELRLALKSTKPTKVPHYLPNFKKIKKRHTGAAVLSVFTQWHICFVG